MDFPAFHVCVRRLIKRLHFSHDICMLFCLLLLCLLVWKYYSPFPSLFSTGALHSRVQVQGECVWELLRYVFVHALSPDPVWPLLVYRYQPWRPDHEGQQGKEDQRSCALPAKSHRGFVSFVSLLQTLPQYKSINWPMACILFFLNTQLQCTRSHRCTSLPVSRWVRRGRRSRRQTRRPCRTDGKKLQRLMPHSTGDWGWDRGQQWHWEPSRLIMHWGWQRELPLLDILL